MSFSSLAEGSPTPITMYENNNMMKQSVSEWEKGGQYFNFQDHEIFYRFHANKDAPVLLLVHGFPTCSWDWSKIWADLQQHFQLLTVDMLGFGFSDKPRQKYSIMQQADIFDAILARLGIDHFHVMAHDYGDTVAQELLARHQQTGRVLSVVLSNGGLFPEMHRPLLLQKLLLSPIGFLISKLTNYKKFKKNFDHICAKPINEEELQNLWLLMRYKNGTTNFHRIIYYIQERKKYRERWVGALQKASVPLHLIVGVLDPISGEHMAAHYEKLISQPDITRLHDVGHYPQLESATEFSQAALYFWQNKGILSK